MGSLSNENFIPKFEKKFIFDKPFALITFHPVTNSKNKNDNNLNYLFKSIKEFKKLNFLFTSSNHYAGGK